MGRLRKLLTAILVERRKRLGGNAGPRAVFNVVIEKNGLEISLAALNDKFKIFITTNQSLGARIEFGKFTNSHQANTENPEFNAAEVAAIGLELVWLSSCWLSTDDGRDLKDFESAVRDWRNRKLGDERAGNPWSCKESYVLRSLAKIGNERD